MSGHSKWSTIKRAKGATDAKRGVAFTKLANAISAAAKSGGGDWQMNFRLRLTIDKAKQFNMPKENIERAIKRGTGEIAGIKIEDVKYEAYGPGGVALIVEAATDNRNRTTADIRSILNKYGGKLAESGAVAYQFKQKGLITINVEGVDKDEIELEVIDAGAEDIEEQSDSLIIYTDPKQTEQIKAKLVEGGVKIEDVALSWEPINAVKIEDEIKAGQIFKLIDNLEGLDDISSVSANFDIADEILEKISS